MDYKQEIRQAVKLGAILISISGILTFSGGWIAHLKNEGWFKQWQPLGKPPETAIRIFIDKDKLLYLETVDGDIYVCPQPFIDTSEGCWIEYEHPRLVSELAKSSPCHSSIRSQAPKPPGKVINMIEFHNCEGSAFGWTQYPIQFCYPK